ncbi:MAG: RNA polymerase sigma factor [Dysgonamonadaceae bacterium]|jgi:RNA polymerase sigma-70 factor (ECF subfamily)|nr:RNA polymerase sigma factor [Dysgonamonadaceae bacterium]
MEQEQFKNEILPLRGQLLAYAGRLLENEDDAEDIVQEVFLKLWRMRYELGLYRSIPALSMKITKHLCLNLLKSNKRNIEAPDESIPENESLSPDHQLEQKEEAEQVLHFVDSLPGLQQIILRMKHIEGLEIEEIAELIGSNPEAVRMNLSRARKKIKDMFLKIQAR